MISGIFCVYCFIYLILISIIGSSSKSFLVAKNLNTNTAAASAKLVTVDRRNISQLMLSLHIILNNKLF